MKRVYNSKFSPLFFALVALVCTSQTKCSDTDVPNLHDLITIRLEGDYANGESGIVTLDGEVIGVVTSGQSVSKHKEDGKTYSVTVVTQNIPTTFTGSVTAPASWSAKCNAATLIVTADPAYAVTNSTLFLNGSARELRPGVATTFPDFVPGKNVNLVFRDQNQVIKHETNLTIPYSTQYTIFVPFN